MKINQSVIYLSCEHIIVSINEAKGTITLRNRSTKLKKPLITVEKRFVKPLTYSQPKRSRV